MIKDPTLLALKLKGLLANEALDKLLRVRAAINQAEDSMTDKGIKDAQKMSKSLPSIEMYLRENEIQKADEEYEKIRDLVIEWVTKGQGPGPGPGGENLNEETIIILSKLAS